MKIRQDLTGQTFGRLTAVRALYRGRGHKMVWLWLCSCGNEYTTYADTIKRGLILSCGCARIHHGATIGDRRSPEYTCWRSMRRRCEYRKDRAYPSYGGRGITVCERWLDFANFLADMGPRPSKAYSLDRYPNNDGNYEPGNVRWATDAEQARNKSSTRLIAHDGRTQCLADWAAELGWSSAGLSSRLKRLPTAEAMAPRKRAA